MRTSFILGVALLSIVPAVAQLNLGTSTEGRGKVDWSGRLNENINSASVTLQRDNDFQIIIYTRRGSYTLAGRWSGHGEQLELKVDRAFNDRDASGKGHINLDTRNRVRSFSLDGKADGRKYSVDFRSDSNGNPSPGRPVSFKDTQSGRGTANFSNQSDTRLTKAMVDLQRDGDFTIKVYGRDDYTFKGKWNWRNGNTVSLNVNEGPGKFNDGSGTLELQGRNSFRSFRITGRDGRNRVSVDFETGRSSGDDNYGRWEFHDGASGNGTLTLRNGGRQVDIRTVRVDMESDGRVVIRLSDGGNYEYVGRWFNRRGDTVEFEITGDGTTIRPSGNGKLTFRGNEIRSLSFSGMKLGDRFRFSFDAR